ncbi:uncharacterized protein FTOL_02108 [Fusarium torulosum]|uniref:JmjC domain-containing protein n=1 Tax=Fusarium torulosum TaxID=33205 RepID=A0AAE8M131_9HYPO|nr:uncharacterized protein FTOL_02108 [Fusarium torulosum]
MSTNDSLIAKFNELVTATQQLNSELVDFRVKFCTDPPPRQRRTRSIAQTPEPSEISATELRTKLLPDLDGLLNRSRAIQAQVEKIGAEGQKHALPSAAIEINQQQAKNRATNRPQLDPQSEGAGGDAHAPTPSEQLSEQQALRQSRGNETPPSQHTPDGQQPLGSEDVTMGGIESADGMTASNGSSVDLQAVSDQAVRVATSQLPAINQLEQVSPVTPRSERISQRQVTRQSHTHETPPPLPRTPNDQHTVGSEGSETADELAATNGSGEPTGVGDDGENATNTVDPLTRPPLATCSSQQENTLMTASKRGMPPEAEADDIAPRRAIQEPTTPNWDRQRPKQWVSLNRRPDSVQSGSSSRSASDSPTGYTASDTSPAGSIATHITWPESSAGACEQDEAMLDVNDAEDSAQTRQSFTRGLDGITDPCSRHQPATDDRASSPNSQTPAANDGTSSPGSQSPAVDARADQSPRNSVADNRTSPLPTVDGGTSPNGKSDTDDNLSQVLASAMDMLSAVTANSPMQAHPPGSGDDQHTDNQETQSPSASPTREESDAASERGSPNTRPSAQPTIQFTPSNSSRSSIPPTRTTLSPADMERLVPRLAELERQGSGQHVIVPRHDNIGLADIQSAIEMGEWQYRSIHYKEGPNGKGDTRVYISEREPPMDLSGFTTEIKRPTSEEGKAIFENATQNPPEGDIPYYVGHADLPPGKPLDPGSFITENPDLKDLYTPYNHIGGPGSANRIHHEDKTFAKETREGLRFYGLRSFNEVYFGSGYKLWLVIMRHHIAKFNAFIRANWKCKKCDHGVSHLCLLVAPSTLEREGIDYEIAVVGRGEAFWTLPGQPHQVINFGYCAARSINFSHPEDNLDVSKASECAECGFHRQTQPRRKRKPHQAFAQPPSRKPTRNNTALVRELEGVKSKFLAIHYRSPRMDEDHPSSEDIAVYKLSAAIRSTGAVEQFIDLVRQWRQQQSQSTFTLDSTKSPLEQAMASVIRYVGKTRLDKFCLRHAQMRLAQEADREKRPRQLRINTESIDNLSTKYKMTPTNIHRHLRDGAQWSRICGRHGGLLAFVFLDTYNDFTIKKGEWVALGHLDNTELAKTFHQHLDDDYTRNLCEAGKIFEEMVSGALVTFQWEEERGLDLEADEIDVLLKQHKRVAES